MHLLIKLLCGGMLAALLLACGQDGDIHHAIETAAADYAPQEAELMIEPPRTAEPPPPPPAPDGTERASVQRRIIYTADVRAQVADLDSALLQVNQFVARAGGYISDQERTNSTYQSEAVLHIRLPANALQPTLNDISALAQTVDAQNLHSNEVTAEWIDLESRLATKREVRDRYIDILRNRAQKVEDILAAEDKIRQITEEIEAKESRLRYLRDQVSLSTLTLNLYETKAYVEPGQAYTRTFGSELAQAFGGGWEMVKGFVLLLTTLWPLLLVAVPLALWLRNRRRRAASTID